MKISPPLTLAALLVLAFTLAISFAPQATGWSQHKKTDNVIGLMFGDGRKLLANQFFTLADVYFHSGYYPSVFDKNSEEQKEIIAHAHGKKESEEDEKNEDFLGQPKDWIEAFGRHFKITKHTHLEHGNEREILPWLRLAADLDPQKVDNYTVGAFFLREHLNRPDQAEAFLREGLRNNPDNCEILFELGRLYHDSNHDLNRARNVWQLGLKKLLALTPQDEKNSKLIFAGLVMEKYFSLPSQRQQDDKLIFQKLVVNLGRLEEDAGHYGLAINWLQVGKKVSPDPAALQAQIDVIQKKIPNQQP